MRLIPDKSEARVIIAFISLAMAFAIVLVPVPFPGYPIKQWMVLAFLSTTGAMLFGDAVAGGS